MSYESYLRENISKRMVFIRNNVKNKKTKKIIKRSDISPDNSSRIRSIELNLNFSELKSFITKSVLDSIFDAIDGVDFLIRDPQLEDKKSRKFWFIFGDENQVSLLCKTIFTDLCLQSPNIKDYHQEKVTGTLEHIKISKTKYYISELLFANAQFSLDYWTHRINEYYRDEVGENCTCGISNSIYTAIDFFWNEIGVEFTNKFTKSFISNVRVHYSRNIDEEIENWCNDMIIKFLDDLVIKYKTENSISITGYKVSDLMEGLYDHTVLFEENSLYLKSGHFDDINQNSSDYIRECAINLVNLQNKYIGENPLFPEEFFYKKMEEDEIGTDYEETLHHF